MKNKYKKEKALDRLRYQSKKENLLNSLITKLNKSIDEAKDICNKLESLDLDESEKDTLVDKLNILNKAIEYYKEEIPTVELYGTHNYNTRIPKYKPKFAPPKKGFKLIYTPMGNKR